MRYIWHVVITYVVEYEEQNGPEIFYRSPHRKKLFIIWTASLRGRQNSNF